jgi:hypothetical protein
MTPIEALAAALHEVMCDVSHHDRGVECSRFAKYRNIALSASPRLSQSGWSLVRTEGLEAAVDDVRYADGNGTSDYWRGFNDGIAKLAARLESHP